MLWVSTLSCWAEHPPALFFQGHSENQKLQGLEQSCHIPRSCAWWTVCFMHEHALSAMKWLPCTQELRNPCKSPRKPHMCPALRNICSGGQLLAPINIAVQ